MTEFVRRYSTALMVIILIISATGLFALARQFTATHSGFSREIQASLERQRMLALVYASVSGAEGGQRGYLLTGQPDYLQPYATAKSEVWASMERLHQLYRSAPEPFGERLPALQLDLVDKFAEMESTLVLYDGGKVAEAVGMVRAGLGHTRMGRIRDTILDMKENERQFLQELSARWLRERDESQRLNLIAFAANVALILLAGYLIEMEKQTRARYAADLENAVEQRTRELSQLSSHLQSSIEHDRRELARELHDELGGLLVAVKMDLVQLRRQVGAAASPATAAVFARMGKAIDEGVALKRRVIEQLRPSLLDNLGVPAALRWQYDESCRRGGLRCAETVAEDLQFNERAGIHVFRIGQEAMTNIVRHAAATEADLFLGREGQEVVLRLADNGRGLAPQALATSGSHGLAGMRHRARELGGTLRISARPGGGTIVEARLPASRVLREPGEPGPPAGRAGAGQSTA